MESDADAYFAKHDIPSVVSDMLFELGFHRPKDVGKFMAAYVERRFRLTDISGVAGEKGGKGDGGAQEDDFGTIEVLNPTMRSPQTADDRIACSLLEEARSLRKKYLDFRPQSADGITNFRALGKTELASMTCIPWKEFRVDYERLLVIFSNPRVWSFCERRLALLRGLFDAHSALNEVAETAELSTAGAERVDTCVQLARSLAPSRLNDFFQRKMQDASSDGEAAEVAPGKTLGDLVAELGGRWPGPTDLTADIDTPTPPATTDLAGVFSRTSNHIRGQFLAECARQSFKLLEETNATTGGAMYAEYRVPLYPGPGAWEDLARWMAEFSVESPRVQWVIQLPPSAYRSIMGTRSVLNFGEMLDNIFGPIVEAVNLRDAERTAESEEAQLARLLQYVSGFELPAVHGSAEEPRQLHDLERDPWDWTLLSSPPYFYQLYHIWLRLKALNSCNEDANSPIISLRCASSDAEPLACAYMLGAAGVSRCGCLGAHSPLQYLFALELDALIVSVSLSSKRSLGAGSSSKAFSEIFRAGVTTALCTEDPTVSQQADNALDVEYALARTMLGLSQVDLAEVARNSMQTSRFRSVAHDSDEGNSGPVAQAKTIRERYRRGRRDAELEHIATLAELATGRSDQA